MHIAHHDSLLLFLYGFLTDFFFLLSSNSTLNRFIFIFIQNLGSNNYEYFIGSCENNLSKADYYYHENDIKVKVYF